MLKRIGKFAAVACALAGCAGPAPDKSLGGKANDYIHDVPLTGCQPADVDSPPTIKEGKRPIYPAGQLMNNNVGSATARFNVTETGAITDLKTEHQGSKYFASHLVAAMQSWVVVPARKGGHPVPSQCEFTMNYGIYENWPFPKPNAPEPQKPAGSAR
jgi:TonB family protein